MLVEFSLTPAAVSVCDGPISSFSEFNGVVLEATRGLGVGHGRLRVDTNRNCAVWIESSVSFVLPLLAVVQPLILGSAD